MLPKKAEGADAEVARRGGLMLGLDGAESRDVGVGAGAAVPLGLASWRWREASCSTSSNPPLIWESPSLGLMRAVCVR